MAHIDDAILQAIESLTQEVRAGFSRVETKQDAQEKRITAAENDIVKIKTVWTTVSVAGGFLIHSAKDWLLGGGK